MFNKPFSNEFTFVSNSEKFISSFDIYRYDKLYLDSLHQFFACRLWQIKSDTESEINKLDFKKKSTREEVYCRLCRSLEYMEDLYDKNISLDELSKHSNISKYHYIRSFKKLFKTTPYGYLTNLRVLKAKVLLQTTELSISEISFNLGYENHSHFSLNFKKSTGFSPYQFRKSQKKSNIL
jgi:AraC-like DNA-binding protein